jgi:oligoribonuclease NrnB/cAMP/cGMP phosphodiesterase (DHH superfamily)
MLLSVHAFPWFGHPLQMIVVIYHGNCADGIVAAWSFTQNRQKTDDSIVFHAATIRERSKDTKMPFLKGKIVYIVDFSYSVSELKEMAGEAKQLILLDHHQTAYEKLSGEVLSTVCDPRSIIDVKRCGAEIVWDTLHGRDSFPWFMRHIRDRDLWLWEHKDSKAFSSAFYNDGYTFETLDKYAMMNESERAELYKRGQDILKCEGMLTKRLSATGKVCEMVVPNVSTFRVVAVQSQICVSEIGHELLQLHPDIHIAAMYHFSLDSKAWIISLRSRSVDDQRHINVGTIAAKFVGGGGHVSASGFGFVRSLEELFKVE